MSKPITVTLPDELHERMQKYKTKMNISATCQAAIEQKVKEMERREAQVKEIPEMEEVLERLRREKNETENIWREKGAFVGLWYAKKERYKALKILATKYRTSNEIIQGMKMLLSQNEKSVLDLHFFDWVCDGYFGNPEATRSPDPSDYDGDIHWEPPVDCEGEFELPIGVHENAEDRVKDPISWPSEDFRNWEDGFMESVRRFWDEVKDKI